jgi:gliding motility-associated-like protein
MPDNPEGNNIFRSQSLNTVMQEMWIYDRQGRVMAHCTGVDCGWDGRDLNGNPCQQGAYVYIINYTTTHNPRQTQSMHGTVTLIR